MNQEKLTKASIELRRKLYKVMQEFWENNKNLPSDQVFFLNSIVASSLISQTTYMLFKKDIGNEQLFAYIDQICRFAKEQLESGQWHIAMGIQ